MKLFICCIVALIFGGCGDRSEKVLVWESSSSPFMRGTVEVREFVYPKPIYRISLEKFKNDKDAWLLECNKCVDDKDILLLAVFCYKDMTTALTVEKPPVNFSYNKIDDRNSRAQVEIENEINLVIETSISESGENRVECTNGDAANQSVNSSP